VTVFDKISSYNLVTNLIPGVIAVEAIRALGLPLVSSKDLPTWLVLAYLLGSISSRVGSLIVDPLSRRYLKTSSNDYALFLKATRNDSKLDILVETSNGYRTMVGGCICAVLISIAYNALAPLEFSDKTWIIISLLAATIIFFISYVKQMRYIEQRIATHGTQNG
jgi:hypothetical protein